MNKKILLMTGTISPKKDINYTASTLSEDTRKLQYLKSIIFYLTQSNFGKIVFCENSKYNFSKEELDIIKNLSILYNKEFELLSFKGDFEKVKELGYGYGEGECIDYAIDNSKYLKHSNSFYKVTGRYIIGNINQIIKLSNNNIIFRDHILGFFSMNTAFFKIETSLYKKYFYDAKAIVNESQNINFESATYSIIYNNNLYKYNKKTNIIPERLNYTDDFIKGHNLKYMRRKLKRYDFILLRIGFYSISPFEKWLYPLITPLTRGRR